MYTRKLSKIVTYTISLALLTYSIMLLSNNNNVAMDSIPNVNYSVENVLKEMPTCNSNDRFRQEVLLSMLYEWTQFAAQHHIRYWISYGTLVGYVQRGGLLPHDLDLDTLVLAQDTEILAPLSDVNFSQIYELKVHPEWTTVDYRKRSYFPSLGIDFVAPNARFRHRTHHYHIDIWPIYDFHPDKLNTRNSTRQLTEYSTSYAWISSPIEWTFPLELCTFSGMKVWCPKNPQKIIALLYGTPSLTESNTKCINGTWI